MSQSRSSASRFDVLKEVRARQIKSFELPKDVNGKNLRASEFYARNVFDMEKMREKLPRDIYQRLSETVKFGKKLDQDVATHVAHSAKEWALANGATHFTHWFQPQTGTTAEKHDAFLSFDEHQRAIEKFSTGQLIQSEPDASSFPSGGIRSTFEARGYTAWDPSSPMFLVESADTKTLCIPSVFLSYTGELLDEKGPLLRSVEAISKKATELLHLIGDKKVNRVITNLGPEQEYFLVDRAFFSLRPDLVMTGRSLLGAKPPRGQQLEDHYFGSIPQRVQAFMAECEAELYKLGVPIKTRHNEVAPSQFEAAPIFEDSDLATDHNLLTMETFRRVGRRHNYEVLFHEKPFAGINGSGKHCNWSMSITASGVEWDGYNLLEPGKTPAQNIRFLLFLATVMKGVYKHMGLLRAAIASPGNDHRLGANEAPPAIISIFMGSQLSQILDEIEKGAASQNAEQAVIKLGVDKLPNVSKDNTDRNRTSPFAFTGNKFEFRAVGGSANIGFPVALLNAAVADGITETTEMLKKRIDSGMKVEQAIMEVVREISKETKPIRFEGNNYSEEWVIEAEKRGLLNLRKTPEALRQLVTEKSKKMLAAMGVLTESETEARYHIRVEGYVKRLMIEAECLVQMVSTQILPSCFAYYKELAEGLAAAKAAGITPVQTEIASRISMGIAEVQKKLTSLEALIHQVETLPSEDAKAKLLAAEVEPMMVTVRDAVDALENQVSDEHWPLPKYREMLFMN